jgi:hypothetical protein
MRTPKLFLDTNLPSKLNGPYRGDVGRIMSVITDEFKIVAAPTTFCELLNRLASGDGSHFESDKEAFRLIVGKDAIEFLPMPIAFMLHVLLGLDSPKTTLGPVHFETALTCLLHAKSREDLFGMRVSIPGLGRCGFTPEAFRKQHEQGQTLHRNWLETVRDGKANLLPQEPWARAYGHMLGYPVSDEQVRRLAGGLDAVYQYSRGLCEIVMGSQSYNFEKHRGDWIDLHQLHYLSDPSIHLLTDDGALRNRVKRSSQGDRVLDFRQFLEQHGLPLRH